MKANGNIAEVLAMYDAVSGQKFGTSNIYENGNLDAYCNETFYNNLPASMQNAIVEKTFRQDQWYRSSGTSGGSGDPIYQATYETTNSYRLGLRTASYGNSISRKCYVLSAQNIIDYLEVTPLMTADNTTLTSENAWQMFWNQTTSPGSLYLWLRSACSSDLLRINSARSMIDLTTYDPSLRVRPAFQIELGKIAWAK